MSENIDMIQIADEAEREAYFQMLQEEAMEIAEMQKRICRPDDCFPMD